LEHELDTRIRILEQLQADAKRYEHLASLNAEQAEAIERTVAQQFKTQSRTVWWQWWAAIIIAIISGFIINWISAPLFHLFTR
jgi:phage gpG-like protein